MRPSVSICIMYGLYVLVADFLDFKQPSPGTNIGLLDLICFVDNGGSACAEDDTIKPNNDVHIDTIPSNAVVVCLANAANGSDVVLHQEVLGQIYELT